MTVGETIADDNPEIKADMYQECKEARAAGECPRTCYTAATYTAGGGGEGGTRASRRNIEQDTSILRPPALIHRHSAPNTAVSPRPPPAAGRQSDFFSCHLSYARKRAVKRGRGNGGRRCRRRRRVHSCGETRVLFPVRFRVPGSHPFPASHVSQ